MLFQIYPQIVCMKGCLVAFGRLFFGVGFQMCSEMSSSTEIVRIFDTSFNISIPFPEVFFLKNWFHHHIYFVVVVKFVIAKDIFGKDSRNGK